MRPEDVRALIHARMEEAKERLRDARILLDSGGSGRSAVACAYYAGFYAVLAAIQITGKVPRKHHGALTLFDSEFVKTGRIARESSATIRRLFRMRLRGDYQNTEPVSREEASEALSLAERFVNEVRDHLIREGLISETQTEGR